LLNDLKDHPSAIVRNTVNAAIGKKSHDVDEAACGIVDTGGSAVRPSGAVPVVANDPFPA
jgi:hypothetical protein